MNKQQIEALKQFQIAIDILANALYEAMEDSDSERIFSGVTNSVGEIQLLGMDYQIQIRLEPNKSSWIKEDGVEFIATDCVKANMSDIKIQFKN